MLSTQILGEFFWIAARKIAKPLTVQEGLSEIEAFLGAWKTLEVTRRVVLEAGRGRVQHGLPCWDAQIWATARLNQFPTALSEDFRYQGRIEEVEFFNPFVARLPGLG